jgi:hypothetical protein
MLYVFKDGNGFLTRVKVVNDSCILVKNFQITMNVPARLIDEEGYVDVEVMSALADKKKEFKVLISKLGSPDFEDYLINDMKVNGLSLIAKLKL